MDIFNNYSASINLLKSCNDYHTQTLHIYYDCHLIIWGHINRDTIFKFAKNVLIMLTEEDIAEIIARIKEGNTACHV